MSLGAFSGLFSRACLGVNLDTIEALVQNYQAWFCFGASPLNRKRRADIAERTAPLSRKKANEATSIPFEARLDLSLGVAFVC